MNWWSLLTWHDPGAVVRLVFPRVDTPLAQLGFLALAAAFAAFAWWCYRREPAYLPARRRRMLLGLRLTAGLVVLFILSGALLEVAGAQDRKPAVLLVVDRSASMRLVDQRPSAEEAAAAQRILGGPRPAGQEPSRDGYLAAAFANPALSPLVARDTHRALGADHALEWYAFGQGSGVVRLPEDTATAPAKAGSPAPALPVLPPPSETATQLGAALADAARQARGRSVDGIVLLTDGGWNRGDDPVQAARAAVGLSGVPVFTVGVGVPAPKDLEVAWIFGEDTVFKNDRFALDVGLRSRGFAGTRATLTVTRKDATGREETVHEEQVALAADGEQPHRVEIQADQAGTFDFTVALRPDPAEGNTANNRKVKRAVRVIDRKLKVLVADEAPRWEYRFLKGFLEADRARIDPRFILRQADPSGARMLAGFPHSPEELRGFDAIVLGDLAPGFFTRSQLDLLERWVRLDGGGLLVVAGRTAMPGAYAGTPLETLLPVNVDALPARSLDAERSPAPAGEARTGFKALLTPEGERLGIFRLIPDAARNAAKWRSAAPLLWFHPVRRVKPGATVGLVHPTRMLPGGEGPMPLFALQRYGKGQVAYLGSDETWRWRSQPGAGEQRRFWGQLVSSLGMPRVLGGSASTLETDQTEYAVGDRVQVVARVLDQALNPLAADSVDVLVSRDLGKESVTLAARPGQPGVFTGEWIPGAEGTFRLDLAAAKGATPAQTRTLQVTTPNLEADDAGMRQPLLEEIAAAGQGAYLPLDRLDHLPAVIAESAARRTRDGGDRGECTLWNAPTVLTLLILLLCGEWFLRKRSDLM